LASPYFHLHRHPNFIPFRSSQSVPIEKHLLNRIGAIIGLGVESLNTIVSAADDKKRVDYALLVSLGLISPRIAPGEKKPPSGSTGCSISAATQSWEDMQTLL
jgi:hypothetical protein